MVEAQLKNLEKRKPFQKGHKGIGGRPRTRDFLAEYNAHMAQGKRADELFRDLRKKKPDIAAYYLMGKPLEQVRMETNLTLSVEPTTIELAAAAARQLMDAARTAQDASQKGVVYLPSDENKTPYKSNASEIIDVK